MEEIKWKLEADQYINNTINPIEIDIWCVEAKYQKKKK